MCMNRMLVTSYIARKEQENLSILTYIVNEALYKYYQLVTSRSIYSDGKILTKKGIEIAKKLGNDTSNSWLTQ